jgi:predicted PurR-regulated permease PerM
MTSPSQDPTRFPAPWNYFIPLASKLTIWCLFLGVLYLLSDFLPLVFLTFVFSYIAEHGVRGLSHRLRSRKLRTAIVFFALIGSLVLLGAFLGPELKNQAADFLKSAPDYLQETDKFIEKQTAKTKWLKDFMGDRKTSELIGETLGLHPSPQHTAPNETAQPSPAATIKTILGVFKNALGIATYFLLAIMFAFLIVRDLPRIEAGVASLKYTKVQIFYEEVSSTVFRFGQVLGRFLEAQLVIAIINTALTSVGMVILGMTSVAFLAGVVFLCSFVPVAGVFISTVPLCLVALKVGGFSLVLWVIIVVCIVHLIEAYVLNPMIMGHHLHLNPVLVLAVLIVGHQLFGIWGLLLSVPTVTYLFDVIQASPDDALEPHNRVRGTLPQEDH